MAVVKELLRNEGDKALSFGDYSLAEKQKVEDFAFQGDLYKVKTFSEITKLEKNGLFSYESVPGTSVIGFTEDSDGVSFTVEGTTDAQITLGLAEETTYKVFIDGQPSGEMTTNLGGKLVLSVELSEGTEVAVKVVK